LENPIIDKWEIFLTNPLGFFGILPKFIIANIFGKVPWAFRTVNILFHIENCFLIYFLADILLNKRIALVTALLASSHPILTESITWIAGGGYAQYTFFILLGISLYLLSVKKERLYYASLISFLIALLTSEKAMAFPFILVSLHLSYPKLLNKKI